MSKIRASDVIAVLSAGSAILIVALGVMGFVRPDYMIGVYRSHHLLGTALGVCAVVLMLTMWGWMIADCIAELARKRSSRLIAWLAVIIMVSVAAWPYYFLEYRRRDRRAGVPQTTNPPIP